MKTCQETFSDELKGRDDVNFINILHAHFAPIFWRQKIEKPREKLLNLLSIKKGWRKMLMKLTHGGNQIIKNRLFFCIS